MVMTSRTTLWIVLALWAALWLGSFVYPVTLPAVGDGFLRGGNRIMAFLALQAGAMVPALAALPLRPQAGVMRWLALVPVLCGTGLIALMAITLLRAFMTDPVIPSGPAGPVTQPAPKGIE